MKQFLLILLCLPMIGLGQGWETTFGEPGNQSGRCVEQTTDGGYIITGHTYSGENSQDFYLVKTDVNGDSLWTKTFGGTGFEYSSSVQQTADGGYIIAGEADSEVASEFLNRDLYLIKTDANGIEQWNQHIGGTGLEAGHTVQQTTDGGYIITGYTTSFGNGSHDAYLVKTDVNGEVLWTKTFGGSEADGSGFVQQTADGGYIISGNTYSFGSGNSDAWLIKTDVNGNSLWTKTFGGIGFDAGGRVQQTTDGGYIMGGNTHSFGFGAEDSDAWYSSDAWLIKLDVNGDSLWTKTFGGTEYDASSLVQQTADGGYIMAGNTYSFGAGGADVWLIKTDVNGDSLWSQTFGGTGEDLSRSAQQTTDGGYIISGSTSSFGNGGNDVYLIKTDENGNSFQYGCTDNLACNYDDTATEDDSSCIYVDGLCETCEDGIIIDNDSDDDGVCDADEVVGCQDVAACNYDALATDPGSCIYVDGLCETCEDGIIIDNDSDDDGVCDADEVVGCQDVAACNYDTLATDPGSCTYVDDICETCEDGIIIDNDSDDDGICDDDEIETYNCINAACIDPGDNTGTYTSLAGCEAECYATWKCFDGDCYELTDGAGEYTSLVDCEEQCEEVIDSSWKCDEGSCLEVSDGSGPFTTLADCEADCTPLPSWDCVTGGCVDPADGSGFYANLADCEAECHISSITGLNKANKKLKKITNLLGQEIPIRKNTPMFYIYDDGSVEKKIIIE